MAETKINLRFFTIPQWEKEAQWLRSMHKKGWKLQRITPPCWYRFERCTPEDVIYQLDFNPEGIEQKEEYVQMFQDCGWEYIQYMVAIFFCLLAMLVVQKQNTVAFVMLLGLLAFYAIVLLQCGVTYWHMYNRIKK